MPESLARKYRPARFSDVVGQTHVAAILYAMAYRHQVPEAILLSGSRGSGKTSTARITAAAVNCEAEPGPAEQWPCQACPSCKSILNGSSVDVLEIDAASNGGVEEIRKLRSLVQYASTGNYRVVILDEVHSASKEAFNSLLKVLEEPPERTIFMLLTTEHAKIMPTILSRCMHFGFRRLAPHAIAARLAWICQQEGIEADGAFLVAIADMADGGMRDAVMMLDQVTRVGITDAARFRALMGESDFGPALVEAMASGDHARMFGKLEEILCECGDFSAISARIVATLRDLLVLLSRGKLVLEGEPLERRMALARSLDVVRVAGAMRVIWDLRTRAGRADARGSLELAMTMCAERLCPQRPVAPAVTQQNGNGAMTHAQLAALSAP